MEAAVVHAVTPLRSPVHSRRTSFVGMVIALASWTMLFASLFFAYAVLRLRATTWPPDGLTPLPRLLPAINTLVLLVSSAALRSGTRPEAEETPGALLGALNTTIALGALFLALQFAVWIPLWRSGFTIASGTYGSIFFGLTTLHAVHVLAGLVALACLVPRARRGAYVSGRQNAVRLTAMFWDYMDVIWVLMFVTIYLI
jgi:cytochrome c oxidase subunit 3